MVVRHPRRERLHVDRRFGERSFEYCAVRKEKAVASRGAYGMPHGTLPDHPAHPFTHILVLLQISNISYASHANENPSRAFDKWHVLSIDEIERFPIAEVCGKAIQECRLAFCLVDPV